EGDRRTHVVIVQRAHVDVLGGPEVTVLGVGGIDRCLRYGEIFTQVLGAPPAGLVTHGEGEGSSGAHQLAVDGGLGNLLAVDVHPRHVHLVLAAGPGGGDGQWVLTDVQGDAVEQRGAHGVIPRAHVQWVEPERGEDEPGGKLPVVLIAGVSLADVGAGEQPLGDIPDQFLGAAGVASFNQHVRDVVGHLVGHAQHA